jgi:hypothetical protein
MKMKTASSNTTRIAAVDIAVIEIVVVVLVIHQSS